MEDLWDEYCRLCKELARKTLYWLITFRFRFKIDLHVSPLCSVSKQIMSQSSVPVVPGYFGEDQSDSLLKKEADQIG